MTSANPYAALKRVLSYRPAQQRHLLRLVVRCEAGRCSPIRVFKIHEGYLVQCRSEADVRDLQDEYPHLDDWSKRRAFFLEWWEQPTNPKDSRLQVVCDCNQTQPRLVDVGKLRELLPREGDRTRNVLLPTVSVV